MIFMLGFSRGALTARSTAGFIRNADILRGGHATRVERQCRTAFYRLLRRLIRRSGAKDRDHEYVAGIAVDRYHCDRRYARAGLIEYLDSGGPAIPVAPARRRATPAPTPQRRERDRVYKPALVQSETTVGRRK